MDGYLTDMDTEYYEWLFKRQKSYEYELMQERLNELIFRLDDERVEEYQDGTDY